MTQPASVAPAAARSFAAIHSILRFLETLWGEAWGPRGPEGPQQGSLGQYLDIIRNLIPNTRRTLHKARKCLPFLYQLRWS